MVSNINKQQPKDKDMNDVLYIIASLYTWVYYKNNVSRFESPPRSGDPVRAIDFDMNKTINYESKANFCKSITLLLSSQVELNNPMFIARKKMKLLLFSQEHNDFLSIYAGHFWFVQF